MDLQTLQITKSAKLIFIILLVGLTGIVFGQSDSSWQAIGSDTVFTNKHVTINNTLDVHGKLTVDSMRVRGPLYIGDSTLSLHHNVTVLNVKSDHIRSTQGRIAFMGAMGSGYNTNIRLGIGIHNPTKPLDIGGAGGIRINQTGNATFNNELYFQDNGQIRSFDNNHRIIFDRTGNVMELRDYGDLVFLQGQLLATERKKLQ